MKTREEAVQFCKTMKKVYEDYPFDENWTVMRHRDNKKMFAAIYQYNGCMRINVKCSPEWILFFRDAYPAVVPAYHMNKNHWNSLILDGTIPRNEIERMVKESYDLTVPKQKRRQAKMARKEARK